MDNLRNQYLQHLEESNSDLEKMNQENPQETAIEQKMSLSAIFRQHRKIIVYVALAFIFLLALYFIYAPSKEEKAKNEAEQGLNLNIPEVTSSALPDNKEDAYELASQEQENQSRRGAMSTLSDFFAGTRMANNSQEEWGVSIEPPEHITDQNSIKQSATAYQEIQHTLGNFYEDNSEYEALQQQIQDLQAQLDARDAENNQVDEIKQQLELMEKSYEMAAKYLPQNQQAKTSPFDTAIKRQMDEPLTNAHAQAERKEPALTVYPNVETTVSTLYQEVSDSVFMAEQMEERNRYFFSATETLEDIPDKNTLKVSVYETVTVKDGETVRLRLLEAARVANMHIPKNTLFTAVAKVQGNRLLLSVTSIEHRERIMSVNLSAYGLDGQQGVFIPNSEEVNALKETVAGMGQSAGTSFTFNSSAGQQLAADAGRGIMQGASQYLNKKMREVKATLKSGHKLFLITP